MQSQATPAPISAIAGLQALVRDAGLDGWLLYDFRGLNPFPAQLLHLGNVMLTRRWFLYIPAQGPATLILHHIEQGAWQQLLPDAGVRRLVFSAHQELDAALRQTLAGARRIAMETSRRGEVPYVSFVDAGAMERVRECGVEVVSSADLLQHQFTWSAADHQAHARAVAGVIRAKDAGFELMDARLRAGAPITELEVQALIVRTLAEAGLESDHPAIVAFGDHASDGHYTVSAQTNRRLEPGQCVLLDIWGGEVGRPMADITWVGYAGQPNTEYLRVWDAVSGARDLAIQLLTTRAVTEGWQVDRAARDLITARGYGAAFTHRLGHSLGSGRPHGPCVNLDDFETHDTRRLLAGLAVTVEPGVYLGPIGIRSEVDVLLTETGAVVTTPIQAEPICLGAPAA